MDKITHKQLCQKGAHWLNKLASNIFYRCPYVAIELSCVGTQQIPDVLGLSPYAPVMIEVKVSRADFVKDFKKTSRAVGSKPLCSYSFYLAPVGIIKHEEIPENWGLLEWDGKIVRMAVAPVKVEPDREAMNYIFYSMLRREKKAGVFDYRK